MVAPDVADGMNGRLPCDVATRLDMAAPAPNLS